MFRRLSGPVIGSLQAALMRRLTGARNVSLAWRFERGSGVYRDGLCVCASGAGWPGGAADH